jgi:hypothetical protein
MKITCLAKNKEIDIPGDCVGCEYYKGECKHPATKKMILKLGYSAAFGRGVDMPEFHKRE